MEIQADAHSGFTTKSKTWQQNYIGVRGLAPQLMSTITFDYSVNTKAYTDSVYPVDIDAPTKVISEERNVEVMVPTSTVKTTMKSTQSYEPFNPKPTISEQTTKTANIATIAILASLTTLCVIGLIISLVMSKKAG